MGAGRNIAVLHPASERTFAARPDCSKDNPAGRSEVDEFCLILHDLFLHKRQFYESVAGFKAFDRTLGKSVVDKVCGVERIFR